MKDLFRTIAWNLQQFWNRKIMCKIFKRHDYRMRIKPYDMSKIIDLNKLKDNEEESLKKLLQSQHMDMQRYLWGIEKPTLNSIKVLGCAGDDRGSGWYRIRQPSIYVNMEYGDRVNEIITRWIGGRDIKPEGGDLKWDIVLYQRQDSPKVLGYAKDLKLLHKVINVYEVDDDMLHVDPKSPAYFETNDLTYRKQLIEFIKSMDYMICSTKALAEMYTKEIKGCPPTIVIPNAICYEIINHIPPITKNSEEIVIGYMGTGTHYSDLEPLIPVIKDILKKYPQTIFQIQGCVNYPFLVNDEDFSKGILKNRIKTIPWTFDMVKYFTYIGECDIGICPLANNIFNEGKSNLKYLQFASMKVPAICTKVRPYLDTYIKDAPMRLVKPIDRETPTEGMNDWYSALRKFIEDKEFRKIIGEKEEQFVFKNYNQKDVAKIWVETFENIFNHKI